MKRGMLTCQKLVLKLVKEFLKENVLELWVILDDRQERIYITKFERMANLQIQ